MDPTEVERDLRTYYDAEAADRANRALDPERVADRTAFLDRLAAERRRHVLEVGIGPGRDAQAFVQQGHAVTGVDLSVEHARLATTDAGAPTAVASVRHLPFPDETFSAAWTMSTLMHVPTSAIAAALGELARVLRPDAPVAVGVWGGADVEERLTGDDDRFGPPRLFSRHTEDRWHALLTTHLGDIEHARTWGRNEADGSGYQYAVVRRRPGGGRS